MKTLQFCALATALGVLTNSAHAYLGGFEPDDGYAPFLNEVTVYNAGQYGVNAGGGTMTSITPDSGLWVKLQHPRFPTPGSSGVAYATGHQNFDRTNPSTSAQALVITTGADGWTGTPQEYSYSIDSFDLGGVSPASTAGDIIDISFWACSRIYGTGEFGGGLGPGTIGNTIGFYDSSGNLGFSLGYEQPGVVSDFASINTNGTWATSGVIVNASTYHRWDVTLDLSAQTVTIDIFEGGTLTNLATAAPLLNPMGNYSELRFLGTPGVNNAKVWSLDDFSMSVRPIPEPGALTLATLVAAGLATSRRRAAAGRRHASSATGGDR